jgi:catechol 2,3-dioxygenase-like lactoylglutathione lyase family enzyme
MTAPVTCVELSSPDLAATRRFFDAVRPELEAAGGTVVVEPFSFPGVGRGCYFTDPAGLLVGLHEYDPTLM